MTNARYCVNLAQRLSNRTFFYLAAKEDYLQSDTLIRDDLLD